MKKFFAALCSAPHWLMRITALIGISWCWPGTVQAAASAEGPLGQTLPLWSIVPFAGMLLSIAVFPLVNLHWWEHNMGKVSLFWGLVFIIPFLAGYGLNITLYELFHIYIIDYIPFLILLGGLFVISGGIIVRGALTGTPGLNTAILGIGSALASLIGTTGASMLLIRPLIRANSFRKEKIHTIIFFIFLVSNIGGSLTPIGDPPLFLGFLKGVPFFWTMRLLPLFALNVLTLLGVYYLLDSYFYKRQCQGMMEQREHSGEGEKGRMKDPVKVGGLYNLVFLLGVIAAVILSGTLSREPIFYDAAKNELRGIHIMTSHGHDLVLPWLNLFRDGIIILMALLSLKFTPAQLRSENYFTWWPIKEVAILFAGIFTTIIPALAILQARGGELGVATPAQFFWATGMLSSFLDNAPTYLSFLSMAGGLGHTAGLVTDLGTVANEVLLAISAGAVFMGANTYIGNAPNFMVRSIAEENGIKMPSFFKYMAWSGAVLIPLFVINTLLFFR